MSDIKARYVGHPDGAFLPAVPLADGTTRDITVPHGGELPTEVDGIAIPASYRDSLLEQKDNWTQVRRGDPKKTTTAAPADTKEA